MDHKIKDQKVFVKLGAVTALQRRYERAKAQYDKYSELGSEFILAKATAKARVEVFEEIIAQLELPIQ